MRLPYQTKPDHQKTLAWFVIPLLCIPWTLTTHARNLPFTQDDRGGQAALNEGDQLLKQDTPQSRRAALLKYKEAVAAWHNANNPRREAEALARIGSTYFQLDEYPNSLEYYTRSLNLAVTVGDKLQQARGLNGMGNVHWATGEYSKALDVYQGSVELSRAAGNRSLEAYALGNIGAVYWAEGEGTKALENYDPAFNLFRDLNDKRGQAFILYNIGLLHAARNESQEAFKNYEQALKLQRETGDDRAAASTLNNIGLVYAFLGEHEKALEYYHQALSIRRSRNYRPGLALTLRNIGDLYAGQAESGKALEYYAEAVPLSEAVGDRRGLGYTFESIGMIHLRAKESQLAQSYFDKALRLFREIFHKLGEATTLANIGSAYALSGHPKQAMESYDQARSLFHAVGDRAGEARTLYETARVERARNNFSTAKERIEQAIEIAELLRGNVVTEDLRATYFATVQDYYDFEIDLLMAMHKLEPSKNYDGLALQTNERARARSLIDTLTESRVAIQEGVDPKLVQRERSLAQQLDEKARFRTQLLSGKSNSEELAAAQKEIDELSREHEKVLLSLKESSSRYVSLTQPGPLLLSQIQKEVVDSNTLLLEYALGEEHSFLWAVTPSTIHSFELPKRSEIEKVTNELRESLRARSERPKGETPEQRAERIGRADAQYFQAAQILSRALLGPVVGELQNNRLLIVAEGGLQYVPFAALPAPEDQRGSTTKGNVEPVPLIVKNEVTNLPSASSLSVLRREAAARSKSSKTIFVFGDPVFEASDPRINSSLANCARNIGSARSSTPGIPNNKSAEKEITNPDLSYQPLPRLLFSCDEALNILSLVPPSQRRQALDFEADRGLAMSEELRDYRIVHFATHAKIDTLHPRLSEVILSRIRENGQQKEGSLTLSDIYNLKLSAELVVLSGCETALGKQVRGEGIIGLTRGFMYAGSPRVVASLWRVDDRVTSELIKIFYAGMFRKNLSPAAALKEAQVTILRKRNWSHPYYWAAFVIQGEPDKMKQ